MSVVLFHNASEVEVGIEFPVESAGAIAIDGAFPVESGGEPITEALGAFPIEGLALFEAVEVAFPIESGGLPLQPLLLLFDVDEVLNALLFIDFDVLDKEFGELLPLELLFDVGDALKPLSLTFDVLDAGLEEAFVGVGGDIQQPVSKVT